MIFINPLASLIPHHLHRLPHHLHLPLPHNPPAPPLIPPNHSTMAKPIDKHPPPPSRIFNYSPLRFSPNPPLPVPDIDHHNSPSSLHSAPPHTAPDTVQLSRKEWRESLSTIIRPTPRYVSVESVTPTPRPLAWRRAISTPRTLLEDSDSPPRHLLSHAGGAESPDGIVSNFFENPHLQPRFGAVTTPGWLPPAPNGPIASRPPIMITRNRPENQDCYCIYAPFPSLPASSSATRTQTADSTQSPQSTTDVLLGIFDGHGEAGRRIAHFSRAFLTEALSCATQGFYKALISGLSAGTNVSLATAIHSRRWKMFTDSFDATEKSLRAPTSRSAYGDSGTTALVALLSGRDLYVAWVGHSRCVVGKAWTRLERHTAYHSVDMSRDHTTNSTSEMKRIKSEAKRLAKRRKPSQHIDFLQRKTSERQEEVSLTRSLGDRTATQFGSISKPEVTYRHLMEDDAFVIVASSGIWGVLTNQEAVSIIGRKKNSGSSAEVAAGELVREAKRRWRRKSSRAQDITAIVMWLREGNPSNAGQDTSRRKGLKDHLKNVGRKLSFKRSTDHRSEVFSVTSDGSLKPFVVKGD